MASAAEIALIVEQMQHNLEASLTSQINASVGTAVGTALLPINQRLDQQDDAIRSLQRQMANQSVAPSTASSAATTATMGSKRRRLDAAGPVGSDSTKVFMGILPRPVLGRVMKDCYDQLKAIYAETLADVTTQIHETGQTYPIQFKSADQARRFRLQYAQNGSKWLNNRDGKHTEIRARGDLPPDVRARKRIFATIYPHIEAMCKGLANWNENFYIRDIWPIIQLIYNNDDDFHFEANESEVRQRGLDIT
ncbi:unnamed protein product, partial [Prorocentrum cordatum]